MRQVEKSARTVLSLITLMFPCCIILPIASGCGMMYGISMLFGERIYQERVPEGEFRLTTDSLLVERSPENPTLTLPSVWDKDLPSSVEGFRRSPEKWPKVKGVVPAGEIFWFYHIRAHEHACWTERMTYVNPRSGPWIGKAILLDGLGSTDKKDPVNRKYFEAINETESAQLHRI